MAMLSWSGPFRPDDIKRCKALGRDNHPCKNRPEYRVIELEDELVLNDEIVGGIDVTALCKEHLVSEYDLWCMGEPVIYSFGNNEAIPGPKKLALLILPMRLTRSQVTHLRKYITEEIPLRKTV